MRHSALRHAILSVIMFSVIVLRVVMLSVIYVECRIFYCSAMFHLQSVFMLRALCSVL
jgi:hypothetical protein